MEQTKIRTQGNLCGRGGFTILELLIAMALLLVIISLVSDSFVGILSHSGRQASIAETETEGIVGLEVLKNDLESAGFGLPWSYPGALSYAEASSSNVCEGVGVNPSIFNDLSTPPRPVLGSNDRCFNGSDYLVIKSTSVARNSTSQKWTYVTQSGTKQWEDINQNFEQGDKLILLQSKAGEGIVRRLKIGSNFWFSYPLSTTPDESEGHWIAYGLIGADSSNNPRFPFNRADYYIRTSNVPSSCASGTGVLYKVVLNHGSVDYPPGNFLPILDCVADFQVVFGFDMNDDGVLGTYSTPDGSTISTSEAANVSSVQQTLNDARTLRKRLKQVQIYILTHEGGYDKNYTYPNSSIQVGPAGLGHLFDLTTIGNYQRYRWKVLSLAVKPKNLE